MSLHSATQQHNQPPAPPLAPSQVLSGIDLESGGRAMDPAYKLSKNIKIAMLYLEVRPH